VIITVFAALIIVGAAIAIDVQFLRGHGPPVFLILSAIFLLLSVALIVLTMRAGLRGPRRWFLLMTGIAAVAFPACLGLRGAVYTLCIAMFGSDFWERIGRPDGEPVFFVIAIFVCPVVFIVGVIGTLVTHMVAFLRSAPP
jgi:cation transporter-like permease